MRATSFSYDECVITEEKQSDRIQERQREITLDTLSTYGRVQETDCESKTKRKKQRQCTFVAVH